MNCRTFLGLLSALAVSTPALAQATAPVITRTVVAAAKLPTVVAGPLHFRAVSVAIRPGEATTFSGANGVLYEMSGSTSVSINGEVKTIGAGEGLFIANGMQVSLKAGNSDPSSRRPKPHLLSSKNSSARLDRFPT